MSSGTRVGVIVGAACVTACLVPGPQESARDTGVDTSSGLMFGSGTGAYNFGTVQIETGTTAALEFPAQDGSDGYYVTGVDGSSGACTAFSLTAVAHQRGTELAPTHGPYGYSFSATFAPTTNGTVECDYAFGYVEPPAKAGTIGFALIGRGVSKPIVEGGSDAVHEGSGGSDGSGSGDKDGSGSSSEGDGGPGSGTDAGSDMEKDGGDTGSHDGVFGSEAGPGGGGGNGFDQRETYYACTTSGGSGAWPIAIVISLCVVGRRRRAQRRTPFDV